MLQVISRRMSATSPHTVSTFQSTHWVDNKTSIAEISFGIGQPSPGLLPLPLLQRSLDAFQLDTDPQLLQYGSRQGSPVVREALAKFLSARYGVPVEQDELFITNGNSHAVAAVTRNSVYYFLFYFLFNIILFVAIPFP